MFAIIMHSHFYGNIKQRQWFYIFYQIAAHQSHCIFFRGDHHLVVGKQSVQRQLHFFYVFDGKLMMVGKGKKIFFVKGAQMLYLRIRIRYTRKGNHTFDGVGRNLCRRFCQRNHIAEFYIRKIQTLMR